MTTMDFDQELFARLYASYGGGSQDGRRTTIPAGEPQTWDEFVGQDEARAHLRDAVRSANARGVPLDHTLLASGLPGIGKTTIARIVANAMGSQLVECSGALSAEDFFELVESLSDRDCVFWDEIHMMVAGNKNRADWILPVLQDGVLLGRTGTRQLPKITVIGATTDVGKLPATIIGRFYNRPRLTGYTLAEATTIVEHLWERMEVNVQHDQATLEQVANAANRNPREMRMILTVVRDMGASGRVVNMNVAIRRAGLTHDGLSQVCQNILLILLDNNGLASEATLKMTMGEPGPIKHHEQVLLQKGLVTITGQGRRLTELGRGRAKQLIREMVEGR